MCFRGGYQQSIGHLESQTISQVFFLRRVCQGFVTKLFKEIFNKIGKLDFATALSYLTGKFSGADHFQALEHIHEHFACIQPNGLS